MRFTKRNPTRKLLQLSILSNRSETFVTRRGSVFMSSVHSLIRPRSMVQMASSSTSTLIVSTEDVNSYDESPPSYQEHERSARCVEDLRNPAPSYTSKSVLCQPSGADQLAEWLVARTSRVLRKNE
jgi:hypothetical protein